MTAGSHVIRIAAALLVGGDGRMLLVRKRGTAAFMQPGGKIEPGEAPGAALVRELREELGLTVPAWALTLIGRFSTPAANEPGHTVEAILFALDFAGPVVPGAEIEEAIWVGADLAGRLTSRRSPGTTSCRSIERYADAPTLRSSCSLEAAVRRAGSPSRRPA